MKKRIVGLIFIFFPVLILLSEYFFLLWCSSSLDFFFVQLLLFSSLNCERVNSFVCISKIHPTNIMKKKRRLKIFNDQYSYEYFFWCICWCWHCCCFGVCDCIYNSFTAAEFILGKSFECVLKLQFIWSW